ncbi:MAG: hypothetical protein GWN99_05430 [Gemmatimonadetes bacterium]|uniref:Uncharacterized protein n=1 Tax=Candidatus Kutchimonas denitrificans TaxID=3056748 RepID=A0AAE5CCL7_9BACT|nr:hypothetical protein [Gemmatimonadota bacterium]NIR76128.1 hypothetical protein [Candidatus Kutchimonas denitrificans]NIS00507.1 hypothetical protein [Gemmatimonadota bacterium]NIT66165.1 hypothetical protein [Gemmatimonadota bacterium]NIU54243.1 hypothetical protein [Gemmatimonadota bacterium]
MTLWQRLIAWLDVRPHEVRSVTLLILGAFLVMSFVVLARSIREALYLPAFPVETLPYVMGGVAVLSVPAVGRFSGLLARHPPRQVLMAILLLLATGLAVLLPWVAGPASAGGAEVVAFYLCTAIGTLLLTSGFWVGCSSYRDSSPSRASPGPWRSCRWC